MELTKYSYKLLECSNEQWQKIIDDFVDLTVYQTMAYGSSLHNETQLKFLVLMLNNEVKAATMIRLFKSHIFNLSIAYVGWGPLWKKKNTQEDTVIFREIVQALVTEYAKNQKCYLRIMPNIFDTDKNKDTLLKIMSDIGFTRKESDSQTLFIDLKPGIAELRKALRKKWRQTLGYAEKSDIVIKEDTSTKSVETALAIFHQMHKRKKFAKLISIEAYSNVQKLLDNNNKLKSVICYDNNEPISAIVWSSFGNTGLPVIAATGEKSLKTNAAYLMWWKMIVRMKESGLEYCNVGGLNKKRNPGGYTFKTGVAHKSQLTGYIGIFEYCQNPFISLFFKSVILMREIYRKLLLFKSKLT